MIRSEASFTMSALVPRRSCELVLALLSVLVLSTPVRADSAKAVLATSVRLETASVFPGRVPDVPALIKGGAEPGDVVCRLLKLGIERWLRVRDMEVIFTRRERLDGKTERNGKEVILLRERSQPWSVYMKWLDGPGKNRELAYVKGRNNGRFKVTPGGLLGWLVVDREPDHPEVFEVSRHTILAAGMGRLLRKLDYQFTISRGDAVVVYMGEARVGKRDCYRFFRFLPEKSARDGIKYYCWKLDLYIDKETCLPVSVKCYGWKRQLDWQKEPFEDYTYTDFVFNQQLSDDAFVVHPAEKE